MTPDRGVLAVLSAERQGQADGIRDYAEQLVAVLRTRRDGPVLQLSRRLSPWTMRFRCHTPDAGAEQRLDRAAAVVLQYNPFSHGRRGFAPGLALAMLRLRCRRSRPVIGLMVHETFVDGKSWRWQLMRCWQRSQLRALQLAADMVFCTIERWSDELRRSWPPAAVHHLPVASNLPDRREHRARARAELGVPEHGLVLCTFGLDHAGRLTEHIVDAARAVANAGRPVVLLSLGTGSPRRELTFPGVTLAVPGYLPEAEVSVLLSAADLFLAPFEDGVSARRTSMMAALQHEIAVVGTDGHLTDDLLRRETQALRLVPVDDRAAFVAAVCALAVNDGDRRALAAAGRRLYVERFDWSVLVERLLDALEGERALR